MISAKLASEMQARLAELERRVSSLIMTGVISAADYETATVKVKAGANETTWLPWLTQRAGQDKSWWAPEVGEQVLVVSVDGDTANGYVLPGALFSTANPANANNADVRRYTFNDGAQIEYDRVKHHLFATLPNNGTTELVSKGGIKFVGDIEHFGKLHNTAGIKSDADVTDKTRSMAGDREIFNKHPHPGVAAGNSNTPPPSVKQ